MKQSDVPQDQIKSLRGLRKAMYAVGSDGKYTVVPSDGWTAEELVLNQAIEEFERQTAEALQRCQEGESSTLEYHMYNNRMDAIVLAQSTGFFKWQVRRHLQARIFNNLPVKKLEIYADVLGISVSDLTSLPEN